MRNQNLDTDCPRVQKLKDLCNHWHYGRLLKRLSESEFDFIVEFIEDNRGDDKNAWAAKVNRLWMDGGRPKHHSDMCDILLTLR